LHPEFYLASEPPSRKIVRIGLFVETKMEPDKLGKFVEQIVSEISLKMIPTAEQKFIRLRVAILDVVDCYFCRFIKRNNDDSISDSDILDLFRRFSGNLSIRNSK